MHSSSSPLLVVKDLSVGYDDKTIVHNVNLEIPNASISALIGPNGCGKSTLIKTMARVLKPSSGAVYLDGENIHHINNKKLAQQLSLLPQGPIAPEGLTVRELVALGRYPHQSLIRQWSKEDEHYVNQALADANISQYADVPVSSLSGGQRQRAWIAMILAQHTDIILLDEPTTYLDMKVQVDVLSLLAQIARQGGRTLVIVLHELNMAAAFADHIIMMKEGRVITSGTAKEVFTSKNLKEVFALEARVIEDPEGGFPVCLPLLSPTVRGGKKESASSTQEVEENHG